MRLGTWIFAGAVALAACGGKKADTTPTGPGTTDQPATATGGTPCSAEVALECGDGMVDGCTGGKTSIHICVTEDATIGPPCEQEIALECPEGQIDACLRTPPAAEHHICVAQ
jgi:hypothetical protein